MFNLFKKKIVKSGLEEAERLGLISKAEFLEVKIKRAKEDLKRYLAKHKKGKRKRKR